MGALEETLVDRIATSAWRLQRVIRIDASMFEYYALDGEDYRLASSCYDLSKLSEADRQAVIDDETPAITFLAATRKTDRIAMLTRYEAAIEQSHYRALRELDRQQAARKRRETDVIDVTPSTAAA